MTNNLNIRHMWAIRRTMAVGYDNVMGLLIVGWRIIEKSSSYDGLHNLVIQSPDKKEYKRLYYPTFQKLLRKQVLTTVNEVDEGDGRNTQVYALRLDYK